MEEGLNLPLSLSTALLKLCIILWLLIDAVPCDWLDADSPLCTHDAKRIQQQQNFLTTIKQVYCLSKASRYQEAYQLLPALLSAAEPVSIDRPMQASPQTVCCNILFSEEPVQGTPTPCAGPRPAPSFKPPCNRVDKQLSDLNTDQKLTCLDNAPPVQCSPLAWLRPALPTSIRSGECSLCCQHNAAVSSFAMADNQLQTVSNLRATLKGRAFKGEARSSSAHKQKHDEVAEATVAVGLKPKELTPQERQLFGSRSTSYLRAR